MGPATVRLISPAGRNEHGRTLVYAEESKLREPVVSAVAPDGRKMLRLEVRNSQTPIERKPEWIKTRAKMGPEYTKMQNLVKSEGLHTVCQEAGCPNIYECWEDREATFLNG